MPGSEYGNIPYEVDEITAWLETWLNDNLPGLLEDIILKYFPMSPSVFLDGIVTGTAINLERINDDILTEYVDFTDIGRYLEVDFGLSRYIRQYRFHVNSVDTSDEDYLKIDRWDGSAWVEWVAEVGNLQYGGWTPWYVGALVATTKIRIVTTKYDENPIRINEMSLKV